MVCWAFSGLSQKLASPMRALILARRDCLAGMSKTVPQMGEAGNQLAAAAALVGVHAKVPRKWSGLPAGYDNRTDVGGTVRVRCLGLGGRSVCPGCVLCAPAVSAGAGPSPRLTQPGHTHTVHERPEPRSDYSPEAYRCP